MNERMECLIRSFIITSYHRSALESSSSSATGNERDIDVRLLDGEAFLTTVDGALHASTAMILSLLLSSAQELCAASHVRAIARMHGHTSPAVGRSLFINLAFMHADAHAYVHAHAQGHDLNADSRLRLRLGCACYRGAQSRSPSGAQGSGRRRLQHVCHRGSHQHPRPPDRATGYIVGSGYVRALV